MWDYIKPQVSFTDRHSIHKRWKFFHKTLLYSSPSAVVSIVVQRDKCQWLWQTTVQRSFSSRWPWPWKTDGEDSSLSAPFYIRGLCGRHTTSRRLKQWLFNGLAPLSEGGQASERGGVRDVHSQSIILIFQVNDLSLYVHKLLKAVVTRQSALKLSDRS